MEISEKNNLFMGTGNTPREAYTDYTLGVSDVIKEYPDLFKDGMIALGAQNLPLIIMGGASAVGGGIDLIGNGLLTLGEMSPFIGKLVLNLDKIMIGGVAGVGGISTAVHLKEGNYTDAAASAYFSVYALTSLIPSSNKTTQYIGTNANNKPNSYIDMNSGAIVENGKVAGYISGYESTKLIGSNSVNTSNVPLVVNQGGTQIQLGSSSVLSSTTNLLLITNATGNSSLVTEVNKRPTWSETELYSKANNPGFDTQVSFLNGEIVSWGTKGSDLNAAGQTILNYLVNNSNTTWTIGNKPTGTTNNNISTSGTSSGNQLQIGNSYNTSSNIPSYVDTSKMSAFEKSLAEILYGSGGTPLVNAPYIKNGLTNGRPVVSASEKLKFETVVYNNQITANGKLYDPNTENLLNWKPGDPRKGVVDFGHRYQKDYHTKFLEYKYKQINLDQLKQFQKNPNNFQIEIPSSNRSNKHTK